MNEKSIDILDTNNTEHYIWGDNCDGWHFVKTESLSVIKERMPSITEEKLHYHEKSQQFFYILSGTAEFEIEGKKYEIEAGKGLHIKPGVRHRILNNTKTYLEFIVVSEPKSHGDRINID